MKKIKEPMVLLMAEDDIDYYKITKDAVEQLSIKVDFRNVEDGEYLMDYLLRRGQYKDPASSPLPDIIFLDLNMPRKSGLEALKEIKSNYSLRQIPIIILTVSRDADNISLCYKLGANSFITKPLGYPELVKAIESLESYWFKTVQLPPNAFPNQAADDGKIK